MLICKKRVVYITLFISYLHTGALQRFFCPELSFLLHVFQPSVIPLKSLLANIWVIVLLSFLLFFIIYVAYKRRIKKIKDFFLTRSRISKNLHDEIGATLSSINIYSEIAFQRINANSDARPLLERIHQSSQQAMENINDMVWFVDPRNDKLENLVAKMQDFAIPLLAGNNKEVVFNIDKHIFSCTVEMQKLQSTYQVFKETIYNIMHHSHAKAVMVKMTKSGKYILLIIEDDGIGFSTAEAKKSNGLKNMLYKAEAANSVINIYAAKGKGCRMELLFPIT